MEATLISEPMFRSVGQALSIAFAVAETPPAVRGTTDRALRDLKEDRYGIAPIPPGERGTNRVQAPAAPTNGNGPEGPLSEEKPMGWLMGLEPTTTGITRRSGRGSVSKIKHLAAPRRRKAA